MPITYFLQQQHQQSLLLPGKLELARDETQHYPQTNRKRKGQLSVVLGNLSSNVFFIHMIQPSSLDLGGVQLASYLGDIFG